MLCLFKFKKDIEKIKSQIQNINIEPDDINYEGMTAMKLNYNKRCCDLEEYISTQFPKITAPENDILIDPIVGLIQIKRKYNANEIKNPSLSSNQCAINIIAEENKKLDVLE